MDTTNETNAEMKSPTLQQLKACQFSSWYPTFRSLNSSSNEYSYPLNNVTIRSITISPLPSNFIEYLKSDGVVLPKGAEKVSSFLPSSDVTNDDDGWSSEEEDKTDDTEEGNPPSEEIYFPALNQEIQNALDTLGPCMPKLNWSAPKDVTWLNESTLKCGTIGDVYLLLKSSDFCMFDLEHAMDDITMDDGDHPLEYELVMRKWSNLHASMEFRCFVSNHELVGICQRNYTQHYPHLKREYMEIRAHIVDFYDTYIDENYAGGTVEDYVFDVYVDKDDRVWLIDFNLWSVRTDALMFKWDELVKLADTQDAEIDRANEDESEDVITIENARPEIRVVMNENEVHYDPLASYRAPIDTVDLASDQAGSKTFQDFMAMCAKPSDIDNESE